MAIETNIQYMEGQWAASRMIPVIEKTTYRSLENAIKIKSTLIEQFESQFGFSRKMENPDSKYAYELGILDFLVKTYENL